MERDQRTCKNVWGMKRDRSTNQQLKTGKKHVDQEKRRNWRGKFEFNSKRDNITGLPSVQYDEAK